MMSLSRGGRVRPPRRSTCRPSGRRWRRDPRMSACATWELPACGTATMRPGRRPAGAADALAGAVGIARQPALVDPLGAKRQRSGCIRRVTSSRMPRSGRTIDPRREAIEARPAAPGCAPCTTCGSWRGSPTSTMFQAQRPMASRLASPTCPASSTTSVSKAPSNSGLQKWKAVPPTTSSGAPRAVAVLEEAWTALPRPGLSRSRACAPARRSRSSARSHRPAAPRGRRGAGSSSSWLVEATATRRPATTSAGLRGRRHGSCRCRGTLDRQRHVLHRQHRAHGSLDRVRAHRGCPPPARRRAGAADAQKSSSARCARCPHWSAITARTAAARPSVGSGLGGCSDRRSGRSMPLPAPIFTAARRVRR